MVAALQPPTANRQPLLKWLGPADYEPTWRAMQAFTEQRGPETRDEIWFLEHPPVFTLGQYLRPTSNHLAIERWVTPEEFERYREWALAKGFLECVAGPLVRSSYRAERALERNNAGLTKQEATTG